MRPSSTKLYSSSRECLWSGAARDFGGIGCSTSEKPPPVSSVQTIMRAPIVWSSPVHAVVRADDPRTLGVVVTRELNGAGFHGNYLLSISLNTSCAANVAHVLPICQD